ATLLKRLYPEAKIYGLDTFQGMPGSDRGLDLHGEGEFADTDLEQSMEALAEARQRLAEVPAEVVVANHAMGLFELAAIHLSSEPPNLVNSALAIDALACLVEGLSERLGENTAVLNDALANIRLAFVQVKGALEG
ncbi:MAG: hypothetical protein RL119_714, partial [Actinomycetota bacterium]